VVNNRASSHSEPKYPYTKLPGALRKILQAIPNRPKPAKLDQKLVVSWGAAKGQSANLRSAVGVLKKVGIIGTNGEPSSLYTQFMDRITGPTALGAKLREATSLMRHILRKRRLTKNSGHYLTCTREVLTNLSECKCKRSRHSANSLPSVALRWV